MHKVMLNTPQNIRLAYAFQTRLAKTYYGTGWAQLEKAQKDAVAESVKKFLVPELAHFSWANVQLLVEADNRRLHKVSVLDAWGKKSDLSGKPHSVVSLTLNGSVKKNQNGLAYKVPINARLDLLVGADGQISYAQFGDHIYPVTDMKYTFTKWCASLLNRISNIEQAFYEKEFVEQAGIEMPSPQEIAVALEKASFTVVSTDIKHKTVTCEEGRLFAAIQVHGVQPIVVYQVQVGEGPKNGASFFFVSKQDTLDNLVAIFRENT